MVDRLKVEFQKDNNNNNLQPKSQFWSIHELKKEIEDVEVIVDDLEKQFASEGNIDSYVEEGENSEEENIILKQLLIQRQYTNKGCDSIILVQHEPVYTLGTASDINFIKSTSNGKNDDIDIFRIERGGEVTYHGPGQLTVYPILDLRGYKQDIHWYMRALEEAILISLKRAGVNGVSMKRFFIPKCTIDIVL